MSKVSICIPAYKQTEFLAKTLDSIKIQNFKDFEIIITDDSPDDSVEQLINSYDFEGKLRYIKNKVAKGSPANWNEAIKQASGEYIKIMHHDDWFTDANSLSEFVQLLDNNPDADFAFSGCQIYFEDYIRKDFLDEDTVNKVKSEPYNLIFANIIGVPSVTIHRKSSHIIYDESLKWLVDIDFYINHIYLNPNFANSKEPLICVCANGSHKITNDCLHNANIDIPEHLYMYYKYAELYGFKINKAHRRYLVRLFIRYKINSLKKLRALALISPLDTDIKKLFNAYNTIRITILIQLYAIYKYFLPNRVKLLIKGVLGNK